MAHFLIISVLNTSINLYLQQPQIWIDCMRVREKESDCERDIMQKSDLQPRPRPRPTFHERDRPNERTNGGSFQVQRSSEKFRSQSLTLFFPFLF